MIPQVASICLHTSHLHGVEAHYCTTGLFREALRASPEEYGTCRHESGAESSLRGRALDYNETPREKECCL